MRNEKTIFRRNVKTIRNNNQAIRFLARQNRIKKEKSIQTKGNRVCGIATDQDTKIEGFEMKIIETIVHRYIYGEQKYYIVDKMPSFLYERKGDFLIAEDSGFFNFYKFKSPSRAFGAFAGRKFDIKLKDGTTIEASGEWWDYVPPDYMGLVKNIGIGTIEELNKCNVFMSVYVDTELIKHTINPSNNYFKYDVNHKDYLKHTIKSKFKEMNK